MHLVILLIIRPIRLVKSFQTTTAKNRLMKTLEFYIEQSATTGNTFTKTFDVFISESKADGSNIFIQSAFVEAFGISKS